MRMSCNGCRVLRKGCSEDCTIRPCLQWINSSESQAHATLFLAKFYGRAGLLNLINAGPPHLRSAIFKSLLYEACGRIINPIYGSVGVLSSGKWSVCQDAVDAVLRGVPITPVIDTSSPPKDYDIRHVMKNGIKNNVVDDTVHTVRNHTGRFKRFRTKPVKSVKPSSTPAAAAVRTDPDPVPDVVPIDQVSKSTSSTSRNSCASDVDGGETNTESVVSVETTEPMSLFDAGVVDELTKVKETDVVEEPREYDEVDLRLRLGFGL